MTAIAASSLVNLIQPAVQRACGRLDWRAEALTTIIAAQAALALAVGAWAPGRPRDRLLIFGGLVVAIGIVWEFGLLLALWGPILISDATAAHVLLYVPKAAAVVTPLLVLRHVCGWRLSPPATEPPLSVRDLLLAMALVAVVLGAMSCSFWLSDYSGPRLDAAWTVYSRRFLHLALSAALFLPPATYLALNVRLRYALPLLLALTVVVSLARAFAGPILARPLLIFRLDSLLLADWPRAALFAGVYFAGGKFLAWFGYRIRFGGRTAATSRG